MHREEVLALALAPGRAHPTSRCVAISLKLLRRQSPDLKLVVSYADFGQGHQGTIYQAGYDRYGRNGQSIPWLRDNVDPRAERVAMAPKLKYVFPLEKRLRRELEEVALPYPKSAAEVTPGDTPGDQPGEWGSSPTRPLHAPAGA